MNALPIALFWILALWGTFSRKPVLLYLFFATMSIGAFAVLPTALTGGLTFTATPIIALLLVARTFLDRNGLTSALTLAIMPNRLMLLTLFWLVAVITTLFMPRLFEGAVMVVPIRGELSTTAPLRPTAQNISQFTYLTISVLSVFAFARILQSPEARQHALKAICLGGAVTVVTGLLDFASTYVPITPLLAPFRTASYALMTSVEVLGGKRVVGLMPEASAYGAQCLGFLSALYFYRRAIVDDRVRNLLAPAILALLALCAWLSTSSGTYVGVALVAMVAGLEWLLRVNMNQHNGSIYRRGLGGELSVVVTLMIALAVLVILRPNVLDPIYSLVDRMVLEKSSSDSFAQRGMWRSVAFASLFDTYGLGVGLGGTRSSSSLVAILSSTGIIGGLLFYGFVLQSFLRRTFGAPVETQLIVSGFRFSFIPIFIVTLMVGDADFGGFIAFGLGITTALAIAMRRQMANPAEAAPQFPIPTSGKRRAAPAKDESVPPKLLPANAKTDVTIIS